MPITKKVNSNANVKQFSDADLFNHITQVAGGSSGGINYINNPGAETDTSGWAAYQNTAQPTPVTGTGGSPVTSLSRTTTSPLRGIGSFLITKDAANRQGEGISYDFTIDSADRAKVLSIQFDYILASGSFNAGSTTTDSDIEMWVYDKTNAALIPVTPFKLVSNSSIDPNNFKGTFQTSANSTSYRLILHIATTNASAWSFKLDNVIVGPQAILNAPSVSDWVDYTPTFSVGFGSVTGVDAQWRRVGDSIEIEGVATTGTVTGGAGQISIPSGLSIDFTKMSAPGVAGVTSMSAIATSGAANLTVLVADSAIGPNIVFLSNVGNGSTTVNLTQNSVSTMLGNTTPFSFNFKLPILGWSSNTITGNDADARIVAAKYHSGTTTFTSETILNFATSDYDTHAAVATGVSWKFIAPVSGIYELKGFLATQASASWSPGDQITFNLYKNGVLVSAIGDVEFDNTITAAIAVPFHGSIQLLAGDFIHVTGISPKSIQMSNDANTWISVHKLSGPALPLATEFVGVFYYQATSFALSGSPQTITFGVKSFDTHGAWNPSTGIFTAPVSGKYRVHTKVNIQVTPTSITGAAILGANNSTDGLSVRIDIEDHKQTATTFSRSLQGSITFNALAGGTINVDAVLSGASGGTLLGGGGDDGYICIEKVD